MDNCPACHAKLTDKTVCRRCKADLGLLFRMERDAHTCKESAKNAFDEKRYHDMFFYAKRYRSLMASSESTRLLAVAALLTGNMALSFSMWRQLSHEPLNNGTVQTNMA